MGSFLRHKKGLKLYLKNIAINNEGYLLIAMWRMSRAVVSNM